MVARASAQPRTVPAVIEQQATDLAETQRAAGRGATALRDTAGNALVMNPDARYPLLRAQDIDAAMAFDADGTVRIMSPDTQEYRDLAARTLGVNNFATDTSQVNGTHTVLGLSQLSNTRINNQLNVYGPIYVNGANSSSLQIGAAGAPADRQIMTYDMTATHNVLVKGNLYVNGQINPPSELGLKRHVADVDDGLDVVRALRPAVWTWRRPWQRDFRRHVGIYVDELAEVAPDAVHDRGDPSDIRGELPWGDKVAATEGRTYEDRALIAYLVSAVQTLAARVERLEAVTS